jgi:hypothetical protein
MKKSDKPQHLPLTVSASFDNFELLETIIEKLSYRKVETRLPDFPVATGMEAIDTSCIEAYVSGGFLLSENDQYACSSFSSCFLFTCIRDKEGGDRLAWSSSFS